MFAFPVGLNGRLAALGVLAACAALASPAAAQQCPDWRQNGTPITTDANTLWAPQRYPLTAGGSTDLRNCGEGPGAGHVMSAPDFTITYDAAGTGHDLDFRVEAQCDTVLLVNDFSATWHYNDDEDATLNPRLRLSGAASGVYDVWVGTWGQQTCPATLVMETFPATGGAGSCPDWSLGGAELNLSAGANLSQAVVAGGTINLSATDCGTGGRGHVAAPPDFTLYYDAPGSSGPLQISVQGQCDTVLLVNDATADWWFNDDHSGLDPQITIPNAQGGRYDIWVGTWGSSLCHATLNLSAQGGVLTK